MKKVEKKDLVEKKEDLKYWLSWYEEYDNSSVYIQLLEYSIYSIELLLEKLSHKNVDIYKCECLEQYYIVNKGVIPDCTNHIYYLDKNDVQGYVLFRRKENGKHAIVIG